MEQSGALDVRKLAYAFAAAALFAAGAFAQESAAPEAIIQDLRNNNLSAEDIRFAEPADTPEIVSLGEFSGDDLQRLQETLLNTEDGFAEVRTAVQANEAFQAALRRQDVAISSVAAITRGEGGEVTIYTDLPAGQ